MSIKVQSYDTQEMFCFVSQKYIKTNTPVSNFLFSQWIAFTPQTYLHDYQSEQYNSFASYSNISEQHARTVQSEHAEDHGPACYLGYRSSTSSLGPELLTQKVPEDSSLVNLCNMQNASVWIIMYARKEKKVTTSPSFSPETSTVQNLFLLPKAESTCRRSLSCYWRDPVQCLQQSITGLYAKPYQLSQHNSVLSHAFITHFNNTTLSMPSDWNFMCISHPFYECWIPWTSHLS
jgi:hypothetical protein